MYALYSRGERLGFPLDEEEGCQLVIPASSGESGGESKV